MIIRVRIFGRLDGQSKLIGLKCTESFDWDEVGSWLIAGWVASEWLAVRWLVSWAGVAGLGGLNELVSWLCDLLAGCLDRNLGLDV